MDNLIPRKNGKTKITLGLLQEFYIISTTLFKYGQYTESNSNNVCWLAVSRRVKF